MSVIEKEAHDQPTQAYFFWILITKEKEERNKVCEKGIANGKEWATFQSIFFSQIPLTTGAVKVSFIFLS